MEKAKALREEYRVHVILRTKNDTYKCNLCEFETTDLTKMSKHLVDMQFTVRSA